MCMGYLTIFLLCVHIVKQSESASIRDEELQGLRQQHALLKKMLEQQQQVLLTTDMPLICCFQ